MAQKDPDFRDVVLNQYSTFEKRIQRAGELTKLINDSPAIHQTQSIGGVQKTATAVQQYMLERTILAHAIVEDLTGVPLKRR